MVRMSEAEWALVDHARGKLTRARWLREVALAAASLWTQETKT